MSSVAEIFDEQDSQASFAAASPARALINHLATRVDSAAVTAGDGQQSQQWLADMQQAGLDAWLATAEQVLADIRHCDWLAICDPSDSSALSSLLSAAGQQSAGFISVHGFSPGDEVLPVDLTAWSNLTQSDNKIISAVSEFLRCWPHYELIHYAEDDGGILLFQNSAGDKVDIRITPSDLKYLLEVKQFDAIDSIDQLYTAYCSRQRMDIFLHLPMLKRYASRCSHVTEFGTRHGISCSAFMAGRPDTLIGFDLVRQPAIDLLERLAAPAGVNFTFRNENILKAAIGDTDLLFIDSTHTYEHLKRELEQFSHYCRRYLVFHDTYLFGDSGMYRADSSVDHGIDIPNRPGQGPTRERVQTEGLLKAIDEFMQQHGEYRLVCQSQLNNGLVILEKAVN